MSHTCWTYFSPSLRSVRWALGLVGASLALACNPRKPDDKSAANAAADATTRAGELAAVTASLSASRLKAHVHVLASDALEGRGPATKGLELAARYIEKEARDIGLSPLFGESFTQPFDMTVGAEIESASQLAVVGRSDRLVLHRDFVPYVFSSTGTIEARTVFLGYGVRAKEFHYDDYSGIDVRGRIVVAYAGEPGEDDPKSPFDGRRMTRHASVRKKALDAREAGASALFVVRKNWPTAKTTQHEEGNAGIATIQITEKVAAKLLGFDPAPALSAIDATYRPASRAGSGPPARVHVAIRRDRRTVVNVGAMWSPTKTATETVVIGAHYDHLGYGGSSSLSGTDAHVIHNGADDNASGVAVVLEVARAISKLAVPLRRRVVFLWFAGEESGLLGSNYFVKHAPFEIETTALMLNLDMVGHLRERRPYVLGVDSAKELRNIAESLVAQAGLRGEFSGDAYGPSDHSSFYAARVPVLFLFTGTHGQYHRPEDDVDTLDYLGMAEVGALATRIVVDAAMRRDRPTYAVLKAPAASNGRGYGPYFGSIPDFAENKEGVPLSGVRPQSPAEMAGLTKGDVIIMFGGVRTKSLQDFTEALRDRAPGDVVEIKFLRGGEVRTSTTTLKKREG